MPPLPPFPFLARVLLRAAIVWIGFRGALLLPFGLLVPEPLAAVVIVAIITVVVFLDLRRRNELIFLGNLGISSAVMLAWAALMPVAGEIVVGMLA